jgi:hypothetical protein
MRVLSTSGWVFFLHLGTAWEALSATLCIIPRWVHTTHSSRIGIVRSLAYLAESSRNQVSDLISFLLFSFFSPHPNPHPKPTPNPWTLASHLYPYTAHLHAVVGNARRREKNKIANSRERRNANSGGAQLRAPPKAGPLLGLRCFSMFRDF